MANWLTALLCLASLCGACLALQPVSSCQDLDTVGCQVFQKANPNLCNEPAFSQTTCKRFCGNCPKECYFCPSPVLDPSDCNSTEACGSNMTCMTKHLHAKDGHHEYIMTCEAKEMCSGLTFGFGKRDIDDVEEPDLEDRDRYEREVFLDCCDTDYCNMPAQTTTTAQPTTHRPSTHAPQPTTNSPPATSHAHYVGHTACQKDIVFVLDDSGSVGSSNFRHMLDFVSQIVSNITIGNNAAHVAVVAYSTKPQFEWHLNTFNTKPQLLSAISRVPYVSGGTRTDLALDAVMHDILNHQHGDRPNVDNAVVVITDGKSNVPALTVREASRLRQYSHDVVSIGVGSSFDLHELSAIATDSHHVFSSPTYQQLQNLGSQITNIICG